MVNFGAVSLLNKTDQASPRLVESRGIRAGWRQSALLSMEPGKEPVARVQQAPGAATDVQFFQGKGGFAAIVSTNDLSFIALPGSHIELSDTILDLPGSPIGFSPKEVSKLVYDENFKPQTVTNQAMILGAGLATRFEPVSGDTTGFSKPGVPLVGEDSVIVAIAKHLKRHGFNRIVVNTYYKREPLKQQLREHVPGVEFVFIDEEKPSGTAGGLARALKEGKIDRRKPILIMQGDAVTDVDLSLLVNTHARQKARATIGVQMVSDDEISKVGIVQTDRAGNDGESGRITSFLEKPTLAQAGDSRLGSTGMYVLSPEVFGRFERMSDQKIKQDKIFDYAQDFFPALLRGTRAENIWNRFADAVIPGHRNRTNLWAQQLGGYWSDVGNPTQFIQAVKDAYAGRLDIALPANVRDFFENGVIYWPGAKTKAEAAGAKVEGNVIVARKPESNPQLDTKA